MYAMVAKVQIDPTRADDAVELLHSFTVPMVKQLPGFVSGTWVRATDSSHGQSLVLFENEESAKAAAERAAQGPPPGAPVTFVSAEVFEVMAQA
ncbi:MAG: antibiotic biosynthesis monooxygenase [Nocardioidaceae bacterium]